MVETMLLNGYPETKKVQMQQNRQNIMLNGCYRPSTFCIIVNQLLLSALCGVKNYADFEGCFILNFDNILDSWE